MAKLLLLLLPLLSFAQTVEFRSQTPQSGTGFSQTFTWLVSASTGASNIDNAYVIINGGLSGTNGCFVWYSKSDNSLALASDSGGSWSTTSTIGTGSSRSNSQCTIYPISSSVTVNGAYFTLRVAYQFTYSFYGTQNVYMKVALGAYQSAWKTTGTWSVPGPPPSIIGTFKNPDGTSLNGYAIINLARGGVMNACVSPKQLISMNTKVLIVDGTLSTLTLYSTVCLTPAVPYTVTIYANPNIKLYQTYWNVPVYGPVDVTALDTNI